jgi:hypothetical protein
MYMQEKMLFLWCIICLIIGWIHALHTVWQRSSLYNLKTQYFDRVYKLRVEFRSQRTAYQTFWLAIRCLYRMWCFCSCNFLSVFFLSFLTRFNELFKMLSGSPAKSGPMTLISENRFPLFFVCWKALVYKCPK